MFIHSYDTFRCIVDIHDGSLKCYPELSFHKAPNV